MNLHPYPEQTTKTLYWAVSAVSKVQEEFIIVGVFTRREDVEAFTSDDPDLLPDSMVAQQVTWEVLQNQIIQGRMKEIAVHLDRIWEVAAVLNRLVPPSPLVVGSPCPVCKSMLGGRGDQLRCANCGWLGKAGT